MCEDFDLAIYIIGPGGAKMGPKWPFFRSKKSLDDWNEGSKKVLFSPPWGPPLGAPPGGAGAPPRAPPRGGSGRGHVQGVCTRPGGFAEAGVMPKGRIGKTKQQAASRVYSSGDGYALYEHPCSAGLSPSKINYYLRLCPVLCITGTADQVFFRPPYPWGL